MECNKYNDDDDDVLVEMKRLGIIHTANTV
jgi:hypothetical protein